MVTLVILAVSFFLTMSLMRWTLRRSKNVRADGIRWRGIDWSGVKKEEAADQGDGGGRQTPIGPEHVAPPKQS